MMNGISLVASEIEPVLLSANDIQVPAELWLAGRSPTPPIPERTRALRRIQLFSSKKGGGGKYVKRFTEGSNIVVRSPDLAEVFPDSDSVNEALHMLLKIARKRGGSYVAD